MIRATALLLSAVLLGLLCGCSTSGSRLVDQKTGRLIGIKGGIESRDHAADGGVLVVETTIGTYALACSSDGSPAEASLQRWAATIDSMAKRRSPQGTSPRLEIRYEVECNSKWERLPYNKNGHIAFLLDEKNRGPVFPFDSTTPGVIGCEPFGEYQLAPHYRQVFEIKLDIPFACAAHEFYSGPHEIW